MDKQLDECVVHALDGDEKDLFPYLPYILQDLNEFGADPETMVLLIQKHTNAGEELKVLDLGCGKGAVSVKISLQLGAACHGIDAVPDFIEDAQKSAVAAGVEHLCIFETDDIREKIHELPEYDVIILGAIGPVFGNYFETLSLLKKHLKDEGILIIDDGYTENNSSFQHPRVQSLDSITEQVRKAGMVIADIIAVTNESITETDNVILSCLKSRCDELIKLHPEKKHLFENYIKSQEYWSDVNACFITCATMVMKKG
jgi:cyclopropane fatty-acyl-phospholipid synthase-like methyltransferase